MNKFKPGNRVKVTPEWAAWYGTLLRGEVRYYNPETTVWCVVVKMDGQGFETGWKESSLEIDKEYLLNRLYEEIQKR